MTALWVILGLIVYLAGFTATARAVNLLDRRWQVLGQGEDVMIAIAWPIVALIGVASLVTVVPMTLLYRFAVRDLRGRP